MKKRLAIAQPAIIDTEIVPLTDSFRIEPNGQTEQWYYENSGAFAPDRRIIPLLITAKVTAIDTHTNTSYSSTAQQNPIVFYQLRWYVKEWNGTAWTRTEVTNTTDDTSHPYVKKTATNQLKVNKNVTSATHGIIIECEGEYTDPRDAGTTVKVIDSLNLTMNQEATIEYPTIDVLNESTRSYNPLRDTSSQYEFNAKADWKGLNEGDGSLVFKADNLGTEEITTAKTDAPASCAPILDIRYDKGNASVEQTDQKFTFRQTGGGLLPAISSGTGKIEKMKGNTVVWNQYSPINNFSNTTTDTKSYFQLQGQWLLNDSYVDYAFGQNITAGQTYKNIITARSGINRLKLKHNGASSDIQICITDSVIVPTHNILVFFTCKSANPQTVGGLVIENIGIIDLTLMFGAGNEPSTVAAFEQWLDANVGMKSYYPYDAGSLIPVKDTTLKTVGFNLWDEQWELGDFNGNTGALYPDNTRIRSKNYIPVFENTNYYRKSPQDIAMYFYKKDKTYISSNGNGKNNTFVTPSECAYVKFAAVSAYGTTYHHDICINLSNNSKNGTYEAHWENNLQIPITTLKGKVVTNGVAGGSDVVMFPDGLKSAGSVCDEINLKTGRAVKRIGKYDLGNAFWTFAQGSTNVFFEQAVKGNKLVCDKYSFVDKNAVVDNASAESNLGNMEFTYCHGSTQDRLYFKNTGYTDADAFKTAMSGVYLYYELATPIEYQFDPIPQGQFEWYGVSNGVEVKIDTMPAYVSGQNTDTLRIDALYGEEITVICRYRKFPWDANLIPQKVYRSVIWRIPDLDVIVVSKRGSSVRHGDTGNYVFETIVNMGGDTISEEIKAANLHFKWKLRKSNSPTVTNLGEQSTQSVAVDPDPNDPSVPYLRNAKVGGVVPSTLVYCEVYLLGAYQAVTSNGVTTYERLLEDI